MMTTDEPTILLHNTLIIADCNEAACLLFRCKREHLIGFPLLGLINEPDFKMLTEVRMKFLRRSKSVIPADLLFVRFDLTRFYGHIESEWVEGDQYQSRITYKDEE